MWECATALLPIRPSSYRIITGSNADKAILKSDGRLYHRGHVFGRASDNGTAVTIGLSSSSKIWSNKSSQLPELIEWCTTLASRIAGGHSSATGSGLDYLEVGEEIEELPQNIIGVAWPVSVYRNPPTVAIVGAGVPSSRLGSSISISQSIRPRQHQLSSRLFSNTRRVLSIGQRFRSIPTEFIEPASAREPEITIEREREALPIIEFLNGELPQFYTADLALVQGFSMLPPPKGFAPVFDNDMINVVDWAAAKVDIEREFGAAREGLVSIHDYLDRELAGSGAAVVYYDHGTGEIADFVAFEQAGERLTVRMYHCKGSTDAAPGHRLSDISEVASQAVKSVTWALKQRILSSIKRRFTQNIGSHRFVRGDLAGLTQLLESATPAQIDYEFVAVQPGLRKENLPADLANMLAAASDHLVRGGFKPLRVLAST